MQAHSEPRVRKRMPCHVRLTGRRHSGMVLNVSPRGLFVQTHADARPGDSVDLELSIPGQKLPIPLQARVVWRRAVPPQLRNVAEGGFGARIENAAETYYSLLADLLPQRSPARRP